MLDTIQRNKFRELEDDQWVDSVILIPDEEATSKSWDQAKQRYDIRAGTNSAPAPIAGSTGGGGCAGDGVTPCASCGCCA